MKRATRYQLTPGGDDAATRETSQHEPVRSCILQAPACCVGPYILWDNQGTAQP